MEVVKMSKVRSQTGWINKRINAVKTHRLTAFGVLALITLSAILCIPSIVSAQFYQKTKLVSNIPGKAAFTDPNLVNPWGIAHAPNGPWWVGDNGTGVSTLYAGTGQPSPSSTVNIPPTSGGSGNGPVTGIVFNGTSDFAVTTGNSAVYIFVTEEGTISAWNPNVDQNNAILKADNSPDANYKGVTIANNGGDNFLYVANFKGSSVDVFDTNFSQVSLGTGAFVDPNIPSDYGPFNVQNIGGKIYVAFAKIDPNTGDEIAGPGFGYVDVFNPKGKLLKRLKSGNWMNAPWGIVLAPSGFGKFSNRLLVGNFGSGRITAFNPKNGNFKGFLRGSRGKPIIIEGLWGLEFGDGGKSGSANTLYFAAGINDEQDGLFGTVTPIP